MGVFVPLLVQPARQCPCNGSSISGNVSARAMGATPSSIIVADMQAMTARDSCVHDDRPLSDQPPQPLVASYRTTCQLNSQSIFLDNRCGRSSKRRCDLRVNEYAA